jgi:DNA repair exonuclease SbcCD ATPase subunit
MTHLFLKKCADIAPTFLILGNHDCNLNNLDRLDALTPIVETLQHPNLYFLNETGIYRTKNFDFVLWSITDNVKNFSVPKNKNKKILLYHGAVDTAVTEHGMQLKNNRVNLDMLSGFDFVLLGDIHKRQYLNEEKTIAYCGSTVQQNYGEDISHGFLFWTISTGSSKYYELKNDWGYFTVEVKNGKLQNELPKFSKYPRVRIKSFDTSASEITKIVSSIKSIATVNDIKVQKFTTKTDNLIKSTKKIGDIRDVEYQNLLITNFLEETHVLGDVLKSKLYEINRQLNTNIDIGKSIRNVTWQPVKFEFSNMFSYGEDNEINFENMSGVYGLFAVNASGKSSIFDSLMFCLFDKCSRTFKAAQVLNNKKDTFKCKFEFKIHNKSYFIERVGIKDKKGHVKVTVNFWTIENGTVVMLNGDDREHTNFIIREYLGNYEEFSLTTLSLQNNNTNFVDKAQRERKDLLSQFLDLNVFEELSQLASVEANQIKAVIKEFSKNDYSTKIADANNAKKINTQQLKEYAEQKTQLSVKLSSIDNEILENTRKLKHVDMQLIELDENNLNSELDNLLSKLSVCETKKSELLDNRSSLSNKASALELELQHDIDKLIKNAEKEQALSDEIRLYQNRRQTLSIQIEHNESKVNKLSTHEYDPSGKYCVNNDFVKDAESSKKELRLLLKQKDEFDIKLNGILAEKEIYNTSTLKLNEYNSIKNEYMKVQSSIIEIDNKLKDIELFEIKTNNLISDIKKNIKKYNENKDSIEINKEIQSKINILSDQKNQINLDLDLIANAVTNITAQIKLAENILKESKDAILKLEAMEIDFKAYDLYLKATNRNGVPYQLIAESLPKIQNEVNSILEQLVDFQLAFETDGKSINVYIIYDDDNFWPLEMTSGMERFISSIAIRIALTTFSNLPRPNFIAIDEGFGVLDSENMTSLYNLFQYMKNVFDFVIIISHIDSMRDLVDTQLNISKRNGLSNVVF